MMKTKDVRDYRVSAKLDRWNPRVRTCKRFVEDDPIKETMKACHRRRKPVNGMGFSSIHLSSHTRLHNVLKSHIGRNWDEVYSDLCRSFGKSEQAELLLQHLFDGNCRSGMIHVRKDVFDWYGFYLDENNLLQNDEYVRPRSEKEEKKIPWKNEWKKEQYHQYKGIWYIVKVEEFNPKTISHSVVRHCSGLWNEKCYPDVLGNLNSVYDFKDRYGGYYRGISMERATTKEIKDFLKK